MSQERIAIVGAGTMGAGIAGLCVVAGYHTQVFDLNDSAIDRAKNIIESNLQGSVDRGKLTKAEFVKASEKLSYTTSLEEVDAQIVIEAALEKLEVKKSIFGTLASILDDDAILASNTSSIPITQIASGIKNPGRVVGLHFFNPAHIMKLVEVISGVHTKESVAQRMMELSIQLGKTPVRAQDAPGFIVNRVARHYYVEALQMLEEGVASVEEIDQLLESSGFKLGPFKLMDLIGVDTNFDVTSSIYAQFMNHEKFRPNRIQKALVDAGKHGKKSGSGFYTYQG